MQYMVCGLICMSMGLGMNHCKSGKEKLNTKSSTESEIVGMSAYVPYNLWIKIYESSWLRDKQKSYLSR